MIITFKSGSRKPQVKTEDRTANSKRSKTQVCHAKSKQPMSRAGPQSQELNIGGNHPS